MFRACEDDTAFRPAARFMANAQHWKVPGKNGWSASFHRPEVSADDWTK